MASSYLTASGNNVYFASHVDMLQKVLGPKPPADLSTAADYVAVSAELGKFLPQQNPNLAYSRFSGSISCSRSTTSSSAPVSWRVPTQASANYWIES